MPDFSQYDGKMVRITDPDGRVFTGSAESLSADWCAHVYDHDEEGIEVNGYTFFASDIAEIRCLPGLTILRAGETWQRAGACYVRIQAMIKERPVPLKQEFDERDGPDTKYIVVTDDGFPVAAARMYELDKTTAMIDRVAVLPEYRHRGIGTMVVCACEEWAEELYCAKAVVECPGSTVGFYQQMDYEITGETVDAEAFPRVRMEKLL